MNYRELLQLYKDGTLDEETRRRVEADIQRQDAISDYLFDEQPLPDGEPDDGGEPVMAMIQKSIRRAFLKMGLLTAAAVLVAAAVCAFVLPSAVSAFYYNPNEIVGRNPQNPNLTTTRLDLDLSVYTEMFLPASFRDRAYAEPEGWGRYRISIPQGASFDGSFRTVDGVLTRNQLVLYDRNVLRPPVSNAFLPPDNAFGALIDSETGESLGAAGSAEEACASLQTLDDSQWYTAYVSLREVTDYADFYEFLETNAFDSAGTWCAVYTEADGFMLGRNMGFNVHSAVESHDWDTEKYPCLCRFGSVQSPDISDPEQAKTHFLSMLRYLSDHPEIMEMMNGTSGRFPFDAMIEDVEANGLRVYGFAMQTKKDTLLQLAENPAVRYIYTVPYR